MPVRLGSRTLAEAGAVQTHLPMLPAAKGQPSVHSHQALTVDAGSAASADLGLTRLCGSPALSPQGNQRQVTDTGRANPGFTARTRPWCRSSAILQASPAPAGKTAAAEPDAEGHHARAKDEVEPVAGSVEWNKVSCTVPSKDRAVGPQDQIRCSAPD